MTVKNMLSTIRVLLYFNSVVKRGKLILTGEENGIKSSNLSKLFTDFEKENNFEILSRNSRGAKPTTAGLELYMLTEELANTIQKIQDFLKHNSKLKAVSLYLPDNLEFPCLTEFTDEYPYINVLYSQNHNNADVIVDYNEPAKLPHRTIVKYQFGGFFNQTIWVSCDEYNEEAAKLVTFIISRWPQ